MELSEIVEGLKSTDLLRQIPALEEAAETAKTLAAEAVEALVVAEFKVPLAERMARFGIIIKPLLEDLLTKPVDDETKMHAAAVLFELGSRAGLQTLLSILHAAVARVELEPGAEPQHVMSLLRKEHKEFLGAILYLGRAHVSEAHDDIERILRKWDVRADPYMAATLVSAMMRTGAAAEDLKRKLLEEFPPAWRQQMEKELSEPFSQ